MKPPITTKIAAERLGTSERRVRQLIEELNIEYTKIGNVIVLNESGMRKMEARKTQRGPEAKKKQ